MDQIIQAVAKKANISPEAAKIAVETVISLLKSRLPAPLASQLDAVVSGTGTAQSGDLAKDAEGLLGGLLGNK